jgi:hypothetical protein
MKYSSQIKSKNKKYFKILTSSNNITEIFPNILHFSKKRKKESAVYWYITFHVISNNI